jgi:hypothetical protein
MKDIIWIVSILAVAVGVWYIYIVQEGFQLNLPSTDYIQRQFWDIVSKKDTPEVARNIQKVRDPAPNDTMPVKFPAYISIYALAKYSNDPTVARKALFDDYDLLQRELSRNVYNQDDVNNWKANTKELTCEKINTVSKQLATFLKDTKKGVVDVSGTLHKGVAIHNENMKFQDKFIKECSKNPISAPCMELAKQNGPIYGLLQKYNNLSYSLYDKEYDISNNLDILHTTHRTLQCEDPDPDLLFNVYNDTEFIDTPFLNEKLQEVSPYYISPETLQYLTSSILSPLDIQTTVDTTSDRYIHIGRSVNNIKSITNYT